MHAETDTEQPTNLDISEHPSPKADREEGLKIMQETPLMDEHAVFFLERTQ